ncbi:hypothetical protein OJ998_02295 [Solirubrobacter taibaiensis]|nr:hypothetical protein [Solirubrobacter taibaiensis]
MVKLTAALGALALIAFGLMAVGLEGAGYVALVASVILLVLAPVLFVLVVARHPDDRNGRARGTSD